MTEQEDNQRSGRKAADAEPDAAPAPHYHGHRERLRSRFLAHPDALPDYELVEMLLFAAKTRGDTKPLAKALIDRFKGIGALLAAEPARLRQVAGADSDAVIAALKVVQEAAVRLARTELKQRSVISSWQALLDYCQTAYARNPVEEFRVLYLDRKNALIQDDAQSRGTIDQTSVYPREVVKRALELGASALILVHNHPSRDPTPSKADIEMTRQVREACKAAEVVLHDHVIVGQGRHASLKALGLL
mgnify:CR=1 FL=1